MHDGTGRRTSAWQRLAPKPIVLALLAALPALGPVAADGGLTVDENKGTVEYEYEIDLPAARGRFQPSVTLRYDSADGGGVALGWSVPQPFYIFYKEQLTPPRFVYSTRDTKKPLVPAPAPRSGYALDVEDGYMEFQQTAQGWEARDATGNRFVFAAFGDGGRLSHVIDPDGNCAVYSYDEGGGSSGRSATTPIPFRRRPVRSPARAPSRPSCRSSSRTRRPIRSGSSATSASETRPRAASSRSGDTSWGTRSTRTGPARPPTSACSTEPFLHR